jgi:hypothetical protein
MAVNQEYSAGTFKDPSSAIRGIPKRKRFGPIGDASGLNNILSGP